MLSGHNWVTLIPPHCLMNNGELTNVQNRKVQLHDITVNLQNHSVGGCMQFPKEEENPLFLKSPPGQ